MRIIEIMAIACMLISTAAVTAQQATDSLGDALPAGAVQRLGTLRMKYNSGVTDIAYLPDGRGLVANGANLDVWDLGAGTIETTYKPTGSSVAFLNLSRDGQRLLFISGGDVVEWNIAEQAIVHRFPTNQAGVVSVCYSPDETRVLTSGRTPPTVKEFDLATGDEVISITGTAAQFYKAVYGPGGKTAFVGTGFETVLAHYDLTTGALLNEWFKDYCAYDLCLSADETRLLVGSRTMASEWEVDGYKELRRFKGHHGGAVNGLIYCREPEQILTGSRDGSIRRWDRTTGEILLRWFPHESYATMIRVSPDGSKVLSYGARLVAESHVTTGKPTVEWERHVGSVEACAWMPDGVRAVSASSDGTLRVWDTQTGKSLRTITGANLGAWSLAVSPDGARAAAGCKDGVLREFSLADGELLREMKGHLGYVRAVAYTSDGSRLFSSADDGSVRIWEAGATEASSVFSGHRGGVLAVAVNADDTLVASGGRDGTVRIWNPADGSAVQVMQGHRGWVECVAFAAGGREVVSTGRDGRLLRWNTESGELTGEIAVGPWLRALAVAPDGQRVYVSGDDATITGWDVATGEQVTSVKGHEAGVNDVTVSPDGSALLSSSADTTLLVWGLPHTR